jgi:hypothetical protein
MTTNRMIYFLGYERFIAIETQLSTGGLNGLFFTLTERLMDSTLVVAAFVSHLTPSPIWVGLIAPISDGGWFWLQLWVSGILQSWPHTLTGYRRIGVLRGLLWLAFLLALVLVCNPRRAARRVFHHRHPFICCAAIRDSAIGVGGKACCWMRGRVGKGIAFAYPIPIFAFHSVTRTPPLISMGR